MGGDTSAFRSSSRHPEPGQANEDRQESTPNHQRASNQQLGVRLEWKSWTKLSILVQDLPRGTTTLDLWRAFNRNGTIDRIHIPRGRNGGTTSHAYVDFSPVPQTSFWDLGILPMTIEDRTYDVRIELQNPRPVQTIKSPVRPGILYHEQMALRLVNLDFGFYSQERTLDIMKTIRHDLDFPFHFNLTVNLKFKKIEIKFPCFIPDPRREDYTIQASKERIGMRESRKPSEYKTEIRFSHLGELLRLDHSDQYWSLIIPLRSPPKFYKRRRHLALSHKTENSSWGEHDTWTRTSEISYNADWSKYDRVSLQRQYQFIDIGRWTTYRLVFPKTCENQWTPMNNALQDFNIQVVPIDGANFSTRVGRPSTFWEMIDEPVSANVNRQLALEHYGNIHLPFDARYQLEAAISQGIFTEQSITLEFLKKLENMNSTYIQFLGQTKNQAMSILDYVTDAGKRIYDPMTVFEDPVALKHNSKIVLPIHCALVRKVTVTPSTIYLSSPTPETTNRVLRQYAKNADRFLRVQFTDERTEGRMRSVIDSDTNDTLFNRVYRTLLHGIQIGDRHFQFLAFGNSQFREHGAYFFSSPADHQSCDDIRNWMGDFSHIKVVAKYASRLGQCFSTTRDPRGLQLGLKIVEIPDIKNNGWCFSDGVGMISEFTAADITRKLGMYDKSGKVPSAFQFRLGGNKGILVTWPDAKLNEVRLRPSQKKFNALAKNIEIIRPSRFSAAALNRQTVAILSCLGVPDEVFVELTRDQLFEYEQAMSDYKVAQRLLGRFVDENQMTTTIGSMIEHGFMNSQEPFAKAVLQLWRAWSMKLLREKARIVVEKGALVFGCVDETHTLRGHTDADEPDLTNDRAILPQIFLQVPKQNQPSQYEVITGLCVVGRNPSLHPGDLRVVEAVDVEVPAIKALRDVVVFPAEGDRNIASMCSGGDLDGDDFFVFWDERLIPKEWNYPPLMHDVVEPKESSRDVQIKDIAKFFVEYMKNDSLGMIAHAHVAQSDRLPDGPKDPRCIELAKLHSNAVDYVKTGQQAHITARLTPTTWPHFMEKKKKSYHSTTVLGQLYDLVAKVDFTPDFESPFDSRILRRYDLSPEILDKARKIKNDYDIAMRRIMNQREIKTEFEVWSTFVLSRPVVGTDYKVQEDMGIVMVGLRDRFKKTLDEELRDAEDGTIQFEEQKHRFIAAIYRITWEEVQIALQECRETRLIAGRQIPKRTKNEMPLISFPWLFESELGLIATSPKTEALMLDEVRIPKIVSADRVAISLDATAASTEEDDERVVDEAVEELVEEAAEQDTYTGIAALQKLGLGSDSDSDSGLSTS
ncbi:RNA dependent RNA polymerase-domain-containing protein [Xylariales sp. AK1849]|nr:RNA dependent RNA polymerase-domain-containing protein [Xylariales sp. AK1849]